jgi:hypothetical protein
LAWLVGKQQEKKLYESNAFTLSFADEHETQQMIQGTVFLVRSN